jgi:hypothetical protein
VPELRHNGDANAARRDSLSSLLTDESGNASLQALLYRLQCMYWLTTLDCMVWGVWSDRVVSQNNFTEKIV